jgi:hypothetical protein
MITLKAGGIAALVAALAIPGNGTLFALVSGVVILIVATCWVLSSTERSERLTMIVRAFRSESARGKGD